MVCARARGFDVEYNELTKTLLAAGYTKDTPPDFARDWKDYYGGWTYALETLYWMVWETPCGLLAQNLGVHGHMSFAGVDWMPENNNPEICCPKFDGVPCELNHPALRNTAMGTDKTTTCACRPSNKPYDYECSFDRAHDDVRREADRLFDEYDERLKSRACRLRSHYNRHAKQWRMYYDPRRCAVIKNPDCERYCKFLQTEMSEKKGNVYYDVKHTWIEKGKGFFPDTEQAEITKGIKLLDRPVSVTLCEAIIKYAKHRIAHSYTDFRLLRNTRFNPEQAHKYDVYNFRCETRASRDLLQDLADARDGIDVHHESVDKKVAAEQKRQRKIARREQQNKRLEALVMKVGYNGMEDIDQIRARKRLGNKRIGELELERGRQREYEQVSFY